MATDLTHIFPQRKNPQEAARKYRVRAENWLPFGDAGQSIAPGTEVLAYPSWVDQMASHILEPVKALKVSESPSSKKTGTRTRAVETE